MERKNLKKEKGDPKEREKRFRIQINKIKKVINRN